MGDHCALYSIQVDGTHRRALTRLRAVADIGASVSPDGSQIAFVRFGAHGIISQVYVIRADGSAPHAVTPPALEGSAPHWSPTGRLITFTSNCCRPGSNIYVMHPAGTGIRRLTHTPFPHNSFQSAYAPQADRLTFASDRRYPDFCCNDLFVMRSNGTQETQVREVPDFQSGASFDIREPSREPPAPSGSRRLPEDLVHGHRALGQRRADLVPVHLSVTLVETCPTIWLMSASGTSLALRIGSQAVLLAPGIVSPRKPAVQGAAGCGLRVACCTSADPRPRASPANPAPVRRTG